MEKEVTHNGKKYKIEIKWSSSFYCVRVVGGNGGFVAIPNTCLYDIEKIKPYIIRAIEYKNKSDLFEVEKWDGQL